MMCLVHAILCMGVMIDILKSDVGKVKSENEVKKNLKITQITSNETSN